MKNPIKPNWKTEIIPILLIAASIIASFCFYANFGERVATHWNVAGEIDGYSSRAFAAFFFPILNIAIYLLMLLVPILDPKKKNYNDFRHVYHWIKGALIAFLSLIYFVVGLNGIGYNISVAKIIPIGIGILFIVIGITFGQVKQNWFMGIRTPWTLSSKVVWEKTHNLGRYIFILAGVLLMFTFFASQFFIWFIAFLLTMVAFLFIYSYIIYIREK